MSETRATAETARPRAKPSVAYFSMEIALDDTIPGYSGGLGVLAGDHLRAAADLGLPIVGVTLRYRSGYFRQSLGPHGTQREEPVTWSPGTVLERLVDRATVTLEGRPIVLGVWRHWIEGIGGHRVPVLLLDPDLDENNQRDRAIADHLYPDDPHWRLRQEAVLGLGGAAMLEATGLSGTPIFHMNEGHSSLLTLALADGAARGQVRVGAGARQAVQRRCVFTTHTPVPEGHDTFDEAVVRDVLGEPVLSDLRALGELGGDDRRLNMTTLGMSMSGFVNAVSLRHREVTASMFPRSAIASITNGVHAPTWTAPPMGRLFDRLLPGWRADNTMLRYAWGLPTDQLDEAHASAKRSLLTLVAQRTGSALDPSVLTLGVARRATRYKRLDLLVSDPERLREIAKRAGPLQIVYAGKAHPADEGGKAVIRSIYEAAEALDGEVAVVFLEDYSMTEAALLCAGSDVWVNTPRKSAEASGTSGMKAALNGVPSLSVLDGWWCEGHVEGVTGWSIGDDGTASDDDVEAEDLYAKLGSVIVPLFYGDPGRFIGIRRGAIALNGSFFTSERMVRQYAALAYRAHDHLEVRPPGSSR